MKCAKCGDELKKVLLGAVEVEQCGNCSGTWFDFGELERVLDREDISRLKDAAQNSRDDDEQRGVCPHCGGETNLVRCDSMKARGVHIDTCASCYGQWLDGGEVQDLKAMELLADLPALFRELGQES